MWVPPGSGLEATPLLLKTASASPRRFFLSFSFLLKTLFRPYTYALLTTGCLTSLPQALSLGNESLLIFFQHSQSILWEADLTSRGPTLSLKKVFLWLGTEVGPILTHYIWLGTE